MAFHSLMPVTSLGEDPRGFDCRGRCCGLVSLVELFPGEVHQRVAQELDLYAVGILEVHRLLDPAVRSGVLDTLGVESRAQLFPAVARARDRDVLDAPDGF